MGRNVNTFTNIANRYAREIVSGKIVACRWVFLACKRHLRDYESSAEKNYPYRFDPAKVEKVCRFVSNLVHVKGSLKGQKITLANWQAFCLAVIFGWVEKLSGYRRFNDAYLEIPRKNGKSVLGAAVGLYLLVADGEPGAEVYAGAGSEEQAHQVFRPAWLMAEQSPGFMSHFKIELGGTAKNPGTIYKKDNDSAFNTVIGKPGDGANVHGGIVDEYHEHKTDELYDTLNTGMGARNQGLMLTITTAGTNQAGPCKIKSDLIRKILSDTIPNDRTFGIIFSIDDDDDWTDIENWKKANPNFGVSVNIDFLKQQLFTAIQSASKQNIIRCKHLNQWLAVDSAWMDMLKLTECRDLALVMDSLKGKKCILGLDLASKIDIAALAILFYDADRYYGFTRFYSPRATVDKPENQHYQTWEMEERLTVTPGPVIDFDAIKDDVREICRGFDVEAIAYDPWQATQLSSELSKEGLTMVEIRATVQNFSEPMKDLEAAIYDKKFHYDGCPILTWMFSNVVAHQDKKENVYPNKTRNENKIDGVVAMIMAMSLAARMKNAVPAEPQIYIF